MSNPRHDGAKIKAALLSIATVEEDFDPIIDSLVERAAAFEALCYEFDGKAKYLYTFKSEVADTSNYMSQSNTVYTEVKYREVHVYEWTLRADDCDDFRAAAIKMATGRRWQ